MPRLSASSLLGFSCLIAAVPTGPLTAAVQRTEVVHGKEWRLRDLGGLDWVIFGADRDRVTVSREHSGVVRGDAAGTAVGTRIARELELTGSVGAETEAFNAWEFDWPAGPEGDDGRGNRAEAPGTVRLVLSSGGAVALQFPGAPVAMQRLGAIWFRPQKPARVRIAQGSEHRDVVVSRPGWVRFFYDGMEPVRVQITGEGGGATTLQNFAAVLSAPAEWWLRDERFVLSFAPVPQAELLRRSRAKAAPDFLRVAQQFADAMIQHGRDRHGAEHSPLFTSSLTRDAKPGLTPYPLYADHTPQEKQTLAKLYESRRLTGLAVNPYNKFNYDRVQNYPKGLGSEGPHKTTVYGSDPFEDRDLYTLLFELSMATRLPRYGTAAAEALTWWYGHTQGAGGLYPWGEHAGWDLVHECPTYYAGPAQGFFEANYHEVRDFLVYPEFLAKLPATERFGLTPLERYAVGIWQHHFWDKQKAWFNRHADIDGIVSQIGDGLGFPAHLGNYLRVWGLALLHSKNASVQTELTLAFQRTLDMAIARTEKYGFFPFTFEVEMKGANPGTEASTQSLRLAHHAFDVSEQLATAAPEIAAKLRRLAKLHLKDQPDEVTRRNLRLAAATGDASFLAEKRVKSVERASELRDFSRDVMSDGIAQEIVDWVTFYHDTQHPEYLEAARSYARIAHEMFCDERSPLPRVFRHEVPLRTTRGEPFPDFYFRGAKLMRAFALVGAAGQMKP